MDFREKVIELVKRIPAGKVMSYGQIAAHCGQRSSARMVGYIMNDCAGREDVPCHRVVNRNGYLTGKAHFGSPDAMEKMLLAEGIEFLESGDNDIRVDMEKHRWEG
ncbi:MAG: MGMT family protein [Candidatus Kapaibacteriales bacterium]